MAPWGGKKPLFGTNPIACALPYQNDPVVIDLSLAKVARGHVLAARNRGGGGAIPECLALDADGAPTANAESALKSTMVPMGDAKGALLALMAEALAAGLTGSHYALKASSFLDDKGLAPATGQLLIAIDPTSCSGGIDHLARLFADVAWEPGTRLPGRIRLERRRRAEIEGICIDPA